MDQHDAWVISAGICTTCRALEIGEPVPLVAAQRQGTVGRFLWQHAGHAVVRELAFFMPGYESEGLTYLCERVSASLEAA